MWNKVADRGWIFLKCLAQLILSVLLNVQKCNARSIPCPPVDSLHPAHKTTCRLNTGNMYEYIFFLNIYSIVFV